MNDKPYTLNQVQLVHFVWKYKVLGDEKAMEYARETSKKWESPEPVPIKDDHFAGVGKMITIQVDRAFFEVDTPVLTGRGIRKLINKPGGYDLFVMGQGVGSTDNKIGYDDVVHFTEGMRLFTVPMFINNSTPLESELREQLYKMSLYVMSRCKGDDWACEECHPESDMIVDGFQCQYHVAMGNVKRGVE